MAKDKERSTESRQDENLLRAPAEIIVREWDPGTRRVDVVILTAIRVEFDAVLQVNAGAVPGSAWDETLGPSGLPVAFRPFVVESGRPLRVAVAIAPEMGATAAVNTLLPLVDHLHPRCIAMCGVCAGRPNKVRLGDVIAADRLYYHDAGKLVVGRVQQDLTTYKLRDDWRAALEGMDVVAHFREAPWLQVRPLTTEWREWRALVALRDRVPEPWKVADPALGAGEWQPIVVALRDRGLLEASGRELTDEGRRAVDALLFEYMNALPDLSPTGELHPFRLHVAPIGSGARVIDNEAIWSFVSQAMRKTLGIEMEAAALGELVHRQRQHTLDVVVMKGVMDFADHGRDDHFKEFAARASAECLLWFLRAQVATEVMVGFDDLLTCGTLPLPSREPSPLVLLDARHTVVPWYKGSRSGILAELDAWADDSSLGAATQLLYAEAGTGKTRLAIEWIRRRRARHDVAGFLIPAPDARWLERLCSLGTLVLVVVDEAETRADLGVLLERVAAFGASSGSRRRVRVLLLARSDGDWWTALSAQHPTIQAMLEAREPITLPAVAATSGERGAMFVEASRAFAAVRRRSPVRYPPGNLDDVRFDRVLYLHMAALVAIEGAPDEAAPAASSMPSLYTPLDAGSLIDEILEHEERFWIRDARDRAGAAIDLSLARKLVAAATLRGGCTMSEASEICARLSGRPRCLEHDALLARLHDIYGWADRTKYLPRLEPAVLGEGMVLRISASPKEAGSPVGNTWIGQVLVRGDDPRALTAAFIVLGYASMTNPVALRPWIANLLGSDLPARAVLALRAVKVTGRRTASSMLGELLAEALERAGSISIALELAEEEIPYLTVALGRVAEWRGQMLLGYAPGNQDAFETEAPPPSWNALRWLKRSLRNATPAKASELDHLAVRLFPLGQCERALAACREAVEIHRVLVARNVGGSQVNLANSLSNLGGMLIELGRHKPALAAARESVYLYRRFVKRSDAFQPGLARSLSNLGGVLSILGQHKAALALTREAVDIHRALAASEPDVFQTGLANSLSNLGSMLSELGQREPALAATREAVNIYRVLVSRDSDISKYDLARSLHNLGNILGELGQREPALIASREAVELCRMLARRNADAFLPRLAVGLIGLGTRLGELGQREAALAASCEAVELCRALARRNPDAYLTSLAMSLNDLSSRLSEVGQHESALAASREAVELCRTLARSNPDAAQDCLAKSLDHMGSRLSELGQREAALAAAREAVELYRAVATRIPDTFRPYLANSLNHLGSRLGELGQKEAALAAAREAVELYRPFATYYPDAFQSALANSLNNLSSRLNELDQCETALAVAREAVGLYRPLAIRYPDASLSELAASVRNLGNQLHKLGQRTTALVAAREAVDLHRALVATRGEVFRPGLAASLYELGIQLGELGQREPALAVAREAVDLYRALIATRGSDTFQCELTASLHDLAIRWGDLGEHEMALATAHEVVELQRTLARRHPDVFQSELAASLNNLGGRLSALGQRAPALVATREAVDLYRMLVKRSPDAFSSGLAASLDNLGMRLRDLGQRIPALAATHEAVDLYRALARRKPATFLPELVTSLENLSIRLHDVDQPEPAVSIRKEAENIRRSLAREVVQAIPSGQHRWIMTAARCTRSASC